MQILLSESRIRSAIEIQIRTCLAGGKSSAKFGGGGQQQKQTYKYNCTKTRNSETFITLGERRKPGVGFVQVRSCVFSAAGIRLIFRSAGGKEEGKTRAFLPPISATKMRAQNARTHKNQKKRGQTNNATAKSSDWFFFFLFGRRLMHIGAGEHVGRSYFPPQNRF